MNYQKGSEKDSNGGRERSETHRETEGQEETER